MASVRRERASKRTTKKKSIVKLTFTVKNSGNRVRGASGSGQKTKCDIRPCWLCPFLDLGGIVASPSDPSSDEVALLLLLGFLLEEGCGDSGDGGGRK